MNHYTDTNDSRYKRLITEGACRSVPLDVMFPVESKHTERGKRVCLGCHLTAECLSYALDNDERHGIWGGKSERERSVMLRDHRLGRLAYA